MQESATTLVHLAYGLDEEPGLFVCLVGWL